MALNTMIDDWREWLDSRCDVVSVFLDLSKAFDTVDHSLLLKKLYYYNLGPNTLNLISNYLSNRSIVVNLKGCLSKSESLKVGVVQGSILGPLLFIIYINDMCHLPLSSKLLLFADDTTVYLAKDQIEDSLKSITRDMQTIHEWLIYNRLILNLKKTHAMHIPSTRNNKLNYNDIFITCGNEKISFVTETKVLGVIIDNKLKFSSHISSICKKINAKTFLLSRTLYLFSHKFRPTLYKLFIQTHFDYCSSLYLHMQNTTDRIMLEKTFIKSIHRLLGIDINGFDFKEQFAALKNYNIFPIIYRQLFHFCSFIHKIENNIRSTLFYKISKHRSTSISQTRRIYVLPMFKTNFYKFSFTTISINFYNSFLHNYNNIQSDKRSKKQPVESLKSYFSNSKNCENYFNLLYRIIT
jgi:hypothetical protein